MFLQHLSLQNFRSYKKSAFQFDQKTTIIVGPNTSGKTNLIEAIFLLSTGKSFRTEKDGQLILFGEQIGRIKGKTDEVELETMIAAILENQAPKKKYLVNGVAKRRLDFASHVPAVLFSPADLDIVIASPGIRRNFLDDVLEQVDGSYRMAHQNYIKALRQRNALLEIVKETGKRNDREFEYWDDMIIGNGSMLTKKREEFIEFLNISKKDIFDFVVFYDASIISKERLLQYKDAEVGAGVTLIGPHRDDFSVSMQQHDVKSFGSRGQQRLTVLQLKLLQMEYMRSILGFLPLLLLDDIFSELDSEHINLVLDMVISQQTIMTTTHKEFMPKNLLKDATVIELKK